MAQIVKPDLCRQLGSIKNRLEVPYDQVMLPKRMTIFVREHESDIFVRRPCLQASGTLSCKVAFKEFDQLG